MPQQTVANPLVQLFPLALIFIIFYFLLIRPQKQKEKAHQKMLAGVSKNDDIVTLGGIHGTVVNVKDKTLTLRVDDNVKIEIEKSSVAYIKKPQNA
ncbi:MAG: preprotein translocase subunit YajC [Candidatus Omnitrophica bacterium]|jgi:preprotein translocase subunit YajC|nr:preprotein translocase subunit YajC [Candidatus Omnitrophota bacterium]